MITEDDKENAEDILREYNNQRTKKAFGEEVEHTCICCQTNKVKPLDGLGGKDWKEHDEIMWNDGTVQKLSFGYGSSFDLSTFFIAICDPCVNSLEEKGIITEFRDLRKKLK